MHLYFHPSIHPFSFVFIRAALMMAGVGGKLCGSTRLQVVLDQANFSSHVALHLLFLSKFIHPLHLHAAPAADWTRRLFITRPQ